MYKRLLVPLDGSKLAESILPLAVCLAKALQASVALIHIIERDAPKQIHGDQHLHDLAEAHSYLDRIASEWFDDVADVETHVHSEEVSDVTRSILQHVTEMNSDLTLMCTHGHSGPKEFLYGSIAQQVAAASVPVLFVRASAEGSKQEVSLSTLLAALDGDPDHERGAHVAAELSRTCQASLCLVTVVPHLGGVSGGWRQSVRLQPSTADRMLDMEVEEAREYLDELEGTFKKDEITVTSEVRRGVPSEEILTATEAVKADLVVLGTHGTVGTEAFWRGSVSAKIARKTMVPVLLVPVVSDGGA